MIDYNKKKEKKVKLGKLVKRTAGGRHAWYESNLGILLRKPL